MGISGPLPVGVNPPPPPYRGPKVPGGGGDMIVPGAAVVVPAGVPPAVLQNQELINIDVPLISHRNQERYSCFSYDLIRHSRFIIHFIKYISNIMIINVNVFMGTEKEQKEVPEKESFLTTLCEYGCKLTAI